MQIESQVDEEMINLCDQDNQIQFLPENSLKKAEAISDFKDDTYLEPTYSNSDPESDAAAVDPNLIQNLKVGALEII